MRSAWFGVAGLLAACAVALAGLRALSADAPGLRIEVEGEGNRATAAALSDRTVIDVQSERGLGRARIECEAGACADALELRLALRGLEELRLSYADVRVVASLASGPGGALSERVVRGPPQPDAPEQPIGPDSPYWLAVTRTAATGPITVELPRDFRDRAVRSFSVSWVDFFR